MEGGRDEQEERSEDRRDGVTKGVHSLEGGTELSRTRNRRFI